MNPFKVLILRNKLPFTLVDDCSKVVAYFQTRLPFPVVFTFQEVDIPISLIPYRVFQGFDTKTGLPALVTEYGLAPAVKTACQNLVLPNSYDAVMFAYDFDGLATDGVITSFTDNRPLTANTQFTQLALNQFFKDEGAIWKMIAHEMMHEFCFDLKQQNIQVEDEMDLDKLNRPFYLNDTPEAINGNFAETLSNLTPFFPKLVSSSVRTLRLGSSGVDVQILQQRLNALGANPILLIDGSYGLKTQLAVKAFQTSHNLQADGIAGSLTQQALGINGTLSPITSIKDIITQVCNQNGVEPLLGIAVATFEGGLANPNIKTRNPNGTFDRGIFAINSRVFANVPDSVCYDPRQATQWFCTAVLQGHLHGYWFLSQHNWITMLTPAIIAKYHL